MNKLIRTLSGESGDRMKSARQNRLFHWIAVILLAVLIQGCTNSKLIIAPLYNRLDDRMRDEFNKLGDFNEKQTAAFEARLGTFHVWHRQSELPQYADLIKTIATSIENADTSANDVKLWAQTAERHSRTARECHPVNFSFELMKSLTDEQLTFIEERFKEEQEENRARYESRTPEERIDRRLRNMTKWAGRIDLDFTSTQRAMLLSAFQQQTSLRKEYYRLSGEWNRQLFELARQQSNPNYDRDIAEHLDRLWSLLESEYPKEWQANRDLWASTALRFIQSMTPEQRNTTGRWLSKMGSTLESISKDEPSFQFIDDPSLGCMVDPEDT